MVDFNFALYICFALVNEHFFLESQRNSRWSGNSAREEVTESRATRVSIFKATAWN